jgi:hypothetical protein
LIAALVLAGLVAGCAAAPAQPSFPKLSYTDLAPYRLAVSRVQLVDSYRPPRTAPNVEQSFPVSPSDTALEWGRDRLLATGGTDRAVYTVLRADAVETALPTNSGAMLSDFENPQSARYDLTIAVKLQVIAPDGRVAASADAKATRSITVAQDATADDRQRVWFTLTDETMRDLNASLEKTIPQYLGSYLR